VTTPIFSLKTKGQGTALECSRELEVKSTSPEQFLAKCGPVIYCLPEKVWKNYFGSCFTPWWVEVTIFKPAIGNFLYAILNSDET